MSSTGVQGNCVLGILGIVRMGVKPDLRYLLAGYGRKSDFSAIGVGPEGRRQLAGSVTAIPYGAICKSPII